MTRLTHEPNPFISRRSHPRAAMKPSKFPRAQSSQKPLHRICAYGYELPYRIASYRVRLGSRLGRSDAEFRSRGFADDWRDGLWAAA